MKEMLHFHINNIHFHYIPVGCYVKYVFIYVICYYYVHYGMFVKTKYFMQKHLFETIKLSACSGTRGRFSNEGRIENKKECDSLI